MSLIPDYTFDFNKEPSREYITKKYFIEWIEVDENQDKHVIDSKDFDTFKEARDYNNASQSIGWIFRNRRYPCQIK